jgi:hypothetical protein
MGGAFLLSQEELLTTEDTEEHREVNFSDLGRGLDSSPYF